MPDKRIENLAGYYDGINPEVAVLLRQASALIPDSRSSRRSVLGGYRKEYQDAIRLCQQGYPNRDLLMRLNQTRWQLNGARVGVKIEVPDLDYPQDEIDELAHLAVPRKLVYIPDQLETTPEGLVLASKMYPKMRTWVGKPDSALLKVTNGFNQGGWVHVEAGWETPLTDTTQSVLEEELTRLNQKYSAYVWKGQRLATYEIGSQDSMDLTGHYFDEQGWVRLLGSFDGGRVLRARFLSCGELDFYSGSGPQAHYPSLGGRFEGAKP